VLGSNLTRDTAYPAEDFLYFPQFVQANSGIVPLLGLDHFLPNSLQFINYPAIEPYIVPVLKTKLSSVVLVLERTMPTERPPLVGEVSANFCG
jgi:hypothetical protein